MTPEQLKTSILLNAIQGKLVEQIGTELCCDIKSTYQGEASDLFDIPVNWKWVAIKDVATINTGLAFKKQDQKTSVDGTLRILRGGNIGDDYKYHLYDNDIYVDLSQFKDKYIPLQIGDVITPSVTSMEKMCKTGFIDVELENTTAGGFVYIIRSNNPSILDSKYLLYFISSSFNKEQCKPNIHKSGQAFYNLKKSGFVEQPICLPPIEEQHRIVSKIEELLPYVDRYAKAYKKLEQFNAKFPEDMKKSILQYAIQGKLVEQRTEEGTAEELYQQIQDEKQKLIRTGKFKKDKAFSDITDDEMPFDIPDNWKWVRVGDIFNVGTGMTPTKSESRFYLGGTIPWVNSSLTSNRYIEHVDTMITQYALDNTSLRLYPAHTLIVAMYGQGKTRGQISELLLPATTNQACAALESYSYQEVTTKYVYYCFLFNYEKLRKRAEGTSQPNLNVQKIKETIIPFPPLGEQQRIVAKIEELLPYCEILSKCKQ